MENTTTLLIVFIIAAVVVIVVSIVLGTGRRRTKARLNRDGIKVDTFNDESGSGTATIKGVAITGSKNASIKAIEHGSHISDSKIDQSDGAEIKVGKGD